MLLKTPLNSLHHRLGAKMVDFYGWEMPLDYGSALAEHAKVRNELGIFDVSHMTIVDILGAGGRQFLRYLLCNDVDTLTHQGRALYSCMCNEQGGIIDDLIVYQRAPDNYRLVLNSATRAKDLAWLRAKSEGFALGLQERHDLAMLAIQGPKAFAALAKLVKPSIADALATLAPFEAVEVDQWFFARTGYTGEEGLEIILPQEEIAAFWSLLIEQGGQACGLAARDSLRLEAGLLLYGQDMDETTTPLESGLEWTVKWAPQDRDFIGYGALLSQKQRGLERQLVGLVLQERAIMRRGQAVFVKGEISGKITSGGYSPSLNCSIALARLALPLTSSVDIEIRGHLHRAKVTKPRFVKRGQRLIQLD